MTSWPIGFLDDMVDEVVDDFEDSHPLRAGRVGHPRMDSRMFSSLIRPRPERDRNTPLNLSVRVSNIGYLVGNDMRRNHQVEEIATELIWYNQDDEDS